MKITISTKYFLSIACLTLFAGCYWNTQRPFFVIENNTANEVRLEFVVDSIDWMRIVSEKFHISTVDQYNSVTKLASDKEWLFKYLCDSCNMEELIAWETFGIRKPSDNSVIYNGIGSLDTNSRIQSQSVSSYYQGDSLTIDKIISSNTITIYLPPGYLFYNRCPHCGDCSCSIDEAFPAEQVRILNGSQGVILLTRNNFRSMMANTEFNSEEESMVLELK